MSSVLALGDAGPSVLLLRQELVEQGFDCGDTGGIFGPAVESEVKLFQASHVGPDHEPLGVDGIVGPRTWWALQHPSGADQHQQLSDVPVGQEASNPVAEAALRAALREWGDGVREDPDGSNRGSQVDKYTGMVGKPVPPLGPRWCAYFVSWCHAWAPGGSPFGRIGGAQSIALWCRKHVPDSVTDAQAKLRDHEIYLPRCGDVGVIANDQVHGHAVLVRAVAGAGIFDGAIWTVEGNCGNAVRSMRRKVSSFRWFVNFDAYARSKGIR